MSVIRPKTLPRVTNVTTGDALVIDGATTRSITIDNVLSGTIQNVTAAGVITVAPTDGTVAVNKTVGAASAVTLPLASTKVGPVLVTDLKRDAGTNNITISPTAPDSIQGLASYTIAADGGSVFLRPISGVGYVL